MTLTVVSRFPDLIPHKVLHDVKSFVVSSDGVSVIRRIITSGTLVSDYFKFGSCFVAVSYQQEV